MKRLSNYLRFTVLYLILVSPAFASSVGKQLFSIGDTLYQLKLIYLGTRFQTSNHSFAESEIRDGALNVRLRVLKDLDAQGVFGNSEDSMAVQLRMVKAFMRSTHILVIEQVKKGSLPMEPLTPETVDTSQFSPESILEWNSKSRGEQVDLLQLMRRIESLIAFGRSRRIVGLLAVEFPNPKNGKLVVEEDPTLNIKFPRRKLIRSSGDKKRSFWAPDGTPAEQWEGLPAFVHALYIDKEHHPSLGGYPSLLPTIIQLAISHGTFDEGLFVPRLTTLTAGTTVIEGPAVIAPSDYYLMAASQSRARIFESYSFMDFPSTSHELFMHTRKIGFVGTPNRASRLADSMNLEPLEILHINRPRGPVWSFEYRLRDAYDGHLPCAEPVLEHAF